MEEKNDQLLEDCPIEEWDAIKEESLQRRRRVNLEKISFNLALIC